MGIGDIVKVARSETHLGMIGEVIGNTHPWWSPIQVYFQMKDGSRVEASFMACNLELVKKYNITEKRICYLN